MFPKWSQSTNHHLLTPNLTFPTAPKPSGTAQINLPPPEIGVMNRFCMSPMSVVQVDFNLEMVKAAHDAALI